MACVTLKRPLAHADYPYENGSQSPGGVGPAGPSVSAPGPSAMGGSPHQMVHPHHRPPPSKRRRCFPMNSLKEQERELFEANNSGFKSAYAAASMNSGGGLSSTSPQMPSLPVRPSCSVFKETSALSPEAIANNLRDELKRLRRRRQISNNNPSTPRKSMMATSPLKSSPPSSPEPMAMEDSAAVRTALKQIGSSSPPRSSMFGSPRSSGLGAPLSPQSCGLQMKNAEQSSGSNKPIFTLKQMTVICDRMCKERTEELRSEYDKILNQKLAEQYDAFVKFIDHQIQQRFAQSQLPSYLS